MTARSKNELNTRGHRPRLQPHSSSADADRQRNGPGGDLLSHPLERVDVERLADMISGKIFDSGIYGERVIAALPGFARRETPLGFFTADRNRARDLALRT